MTTYRIPFLLFISTIIIIVGALLFTADGTATAASSHLAADPTPPADGDINPAMSAVLEDQLPPKAQPMQPSTDCVGGMAGTYECKNVDLLAFLPLADIGGGSGNDIWGWTDPQTGREYAIMGRTNGTAFVDITTPTAPVYLGNLPTHTSSSTWRDVKVYADHAFVVSEASGHGMQIFDLTQLRSVAAPPQTFASTAHYDGFGRAHNIVINEDTGYAYGVGANAGSQSGCAGGLHMVDISAPTNPQFAGCFSSDGYTHDAQCVVYAGPDTNYNGREICFNANEDTLTIVDVENKNSPVQLAREGYGTVGYAHQGWLTEDQQYFLMNDELDESNNGHNTYTYIWDVRDLNNPVLINTYVSALPAIDHNMYVVDDYLYQANYRAGLRILSLQDVASGQLTEEAFFDIYPGSNSANFNGAWSVYPFFDSGVVVVSGIEQGLYVLRPQLEPDFLLTADPVRNAVCQGTPIQYAVDVDSIQEFNQTVTLSTADLPGGSTASFTTNPVTPPNTSDLLIDATGTAAGSHLFHLVGSSVTRTHTTTLQLDLFAEQPAAPFLTLPFDGLNGAAQTPTLQWNGSPQADSYLVEIAADSGFNTIVESTTVSTAEYTLSASLTAGTVYHWRVTAQNPCGNQQSAVSTFTTATESLMCNSLVTFENGLPADWSATDDSSSGNGIVWTPSDDSACGIGNLTNGSGTAMCADSDAAGSSAPAYDTSLLSPILDLSSVSSIQLDTTAYYRDLNAGGNDMFTVDVWNGSGWQNELSWNEDHRPEDVTLNLSAYTGVAAAQLRFRYEGDGWDWYAQVDDVRLTCSCPLPAAPTLNSAVSGNDIVLSLTGASADRYQIHWSTAAYYPAAADSWKATAGGSGYTHSGAGGSGPYYYYAVPMDICGTTAVDGSASNHVGAFSFALTPGD